MTNSMKMAGQHFLREDEIDSLRKSYEIGDHWELRRAFMSAHREQFPKTRLISLAQMFVNIETMRTT